MRSRPPADLHRRSSPSSAPSSTFLLPRERWPRPLLLLSGRPPAWTRPFSARALFSSPPNSSSPASFPPVRFQLVQRQGPSSPAPPFSLRAFALTAQELQRPAPPSLRPSQGLGPFEPRPFSPSAELPAPTPASLPRSGEIFLPFLTSGERAERPPRLSLPTRRDLFSPRQSFSASPAPPWWRRERKICRPPWTASVPEALSFSSLTWMSSSAG